MVKLLATMAVAVPFAIWIARADTEEQQGTGKGTFAAVMNELACCAENKKIYIPEYGEKIREISGVNGVNGELKLIAKDLMMGDHRNGGSK